MLSTSRAVFNDVTFQFEVRYDRPLEDRNRVWQIPTYGPGQLALPFAMPPHPCQVLITPFASRLPKVPAFTFNRTDYMAALRAHPPDADGEVMAHTFVALAAPRLDIALLAGGTELRISWPAADPTYVLEFTGSLNSPVNWGRVPFFPARQGDRFVVTAPLPNGPTFLRLRQP